MSQISNPRRVLRRAEARIRILPGSASVADALDILREEIDADPIPAEAAPGNSWKIELCSEPGCNERLKVEHWGDNRWACPVHGNKVTIRQVTVVEQQPSPEAAADGGTLSLTEAVEIYRESHEHSDAEVRRRIESLCRHAAHARAMAAHSEGTSPSEAEDESNYSYAFNEGWKEGQEALDHRFEDLVRAAHSVIEKLRFEPGGMIPLLGLPDQPIQDLLTALDNVASCEGALRQAPTDDAAVIAFFEATRELRGLYEEDMGRGSELLARKRRVTFSEVRAAHEKVEQLGQALFSRTEDAESALDAAAVSAQV